MTQGLVGVVQLQHWSATCARLLMPEIMVGMLALKLLCLLHRLIVDITLSSLIWRDALMLMRVVT